MKADMTPENQADDTAVADEVDVNVDEAQGTEVYESEDESDKYEQEILTDEAIVDETVEELTDEAADLTSSEDESQGEAFVPAVKVKGIYVTGPIAGSERMSELTELVSTTELNTMVIDIKNDEGNITYEMNNADVVNMEASIRYIKDMKALIDDLHQKDIYVIGRIVCFKDPILAKYKPELALKTPSGKAVMDANGLEWVNPYKEEVWDYICGLAETASLDGFDEIQFDYVRFPIGEDANHADYGVDLETYPREQGLTDFFMYVSNRLHGKNIIYGADLFGTVIGSDTDRDRTGQDYVELVELNDVVCPMVYPSHYAGGTFGLDVPDAHPYETILNAMNLSKTVIEEADLSEKGIVRPWLQCFNAVWVNGHITYDSEQIKEQIEAVYAAGYDEWILWNASNHYEQVADALTLLSSGQP